MAEVKETGGTRIIERADQGSVLCVKAACLAVVAGPDQGKEYAVEGRAVQVGSGPSNDLVLSDPAISAAHFSIELDEHGFLLRDLGSSNGTFVDSYRAQGLYLPAQATIELGQTRIRFIASGEELEIPLSQRTRFGGLLGHSPAMRQVFAILERVADTDSTVLLEGESGTGKEVAARALHEQSSRRGELFVTVDCGSLPASLVESELFGHAKGAFTGAVTAKAGLFEEADGGTLFLDEIGELPLDLQPKLLRTLETRTVRRLGETKTVSINTRLIAATNRNLSWEVETNRFRKDLFFRLSVIRVRLPALRERREEIPRLVSHFLARLGRDPSQKLDGSTMEMLANYSWPGNVRELRNAVERLVLLPGMQPEFYLGGSTSSPTSETAAVAAPDAAATVALPLDQPFHEGKRIWTERFEREYLARLLVKCKGNISEVARVSGLSRQSCHRLLSRYQLGL